MGDLSAYAKDVANNTQMLAPVAPSDKKAIELGTKVVTDAVHEQIDMDKPLALRPFNDLSSLVVS